jgi:hypothetical protein
MATTVSYFNFGKQNKKKSKQIVKFTHKKKEHGHFG